jgi:hypothetical protein
MSSSKLTQVLRLFEGSKDSLSVASIAQDLDVSIERVESMIQYWVRKGRIREAGLSDKCGTCGSSGHCPFVIRLPRSYELATPENLIMVETVEPCGSPGCGCS